MPSHGYCGFVAQDIEAYLDWSDPKIPKNPEVMSVEITTRHGQGHGILGITKNHNDGHRHSPRESALRYNINI